MWVFRAPNFVFSLLEYPKKHFLCDSYNKSVLLKHFIYALVNISMNDPLLQPEEVFLFILRYKLLLL